MINLLPTEHKESILYARRNSHLLKWGFAVSIAIAVAFIIIGAGYLYIADATNKVQTQVATLEQELQEQELEATQAELQNISNNIRLINQVLSKQVDFPELIRQIGAVMPAQSVLSSIELSELEGGIDLVALAQNYNTATQVQVNLEDPENKIFDKVDIIVINCEPSDDDERALYPCSVSLRARFADESPFKLSQPTPPETNEDGGEDQ